MPINVESWLANGFHSVTHINQWSSQFAHTMGFCIDHLNAAQKPARFWGKNYSAHPIIIIFSMLQLKSHLNHTYRLLTYIPMCHSSHSLYVHILFRAIACSVLFTFIDTAVAVVVFFFVFTESTLCTTHAGCLVAHFTIFASHQFVCYRWIRCCRTCSLHTQVRIYLAIQFLAEKKTFPTPELSDINRLYRVTGTTNSRNNNNNSLTQAPTNNKKNYNQSRIAPNSLIYGYSFCLFVICSLNRS